MKAPITQSPEWKALQDDLGETSFFEQGNGYQYLAILKSTPLGKYLYLPYGPAYKDSTGRQNALKKLKQLATKHQAIFIRIEPTDPDFAKHLPHNAVKTTDLNPKETWLLDLKGCDDDLKAKLPSRLLRYHRNMAKNGLEIKTSKDPADIKYLLELQQALASKKGINTFSERYLQTELSQPFATLYLVVADDAVASRNTLSRSINDDGSFTERPSPVTDSSRKRVKNVLAHSSELTMNGRPEGSTGARERSEKDVSLTQRSIVAAGLVFDDRTTRYNLQGAQSEQGRKLHATGILTIQLILDAKAKGLTTFDFWGIAPEGAPASHPWAGFTNFKKTFSGYEVDHAGTYDLVLDKKKYKFYQLTRKLNRIIRRIK